MTLQERVVLIDDADWREFERIHPEDPAAYATATLGVEGDRLRQERVRYGDAAGARTSAATRATALRRTS